MANVLHSNNIKNLDFIIIKYKAIPTIAKEIYINSLMLVETKKENLIDKLAF